MRALALRGFDRPPRVVEIPAPGPGPASTRDRRRGGVERRWEPALLGPLADMVAEDTLRVAIHRTYPLGDAAPALEDFSTQHTLGKLVVLVG